MNQERVSQNILFPISTSQAKHLASEMGNCNENGLRHVQNRPAAISSKGPGQVSARDPLCAITLAMLYKRQTAYFLAVGIQRILIFCCWKQSTVLQLQV